MFRAIKVWLFQRKIKKYIKFLVKMVNKPMEPKKKSVDEQEAEMRRLGLCGSFDGWIQHLKDKTESNRNLSALEKVENFLERQLDENEELMATCNPENVKFWQGAVKQSRIDLEFVENLIKEYSASGKQEQKTKKSVSEVLDEAISELQERLDLTQNAMKSTDNCSIFREYSQRQYQLIDIIKLLKKLKEENA